MTYWPLSQAVILPTDRSFSTPNTLVTKDLSGASMANCQMSAQKEAPPKLDLARYNSRYRRVGFAGSEIFGFGHP